MINAPLMRTVVDKIKRHPEQLDMDTWAETTDCGTTACFAGHTLAESGYTLKVESINSLGDIVNFYEPDGELALPGYKIMEHARLLLGITPAEANQLFLEATNDDVIDTAKAIAETYGVQL